MKLRSYQRECLDKIKELHTQGKHRQLVSLATAGGKTIIFAHLIKELQCRALIIAHTAELLEQAKEKKAGIEKLTRGQASDLMRSGALLRGRR